MRYPFVGGNESAGSPHNHDRHLDIHQYYLVKSFFRLGDFMYGVEPIYRRIDSDTGAADDLYGDLTI